MVPSYVDPEKAILIANQMLEKADTSYDNEQLSEEDYEEECRFWVAILDKEGRNLGPEERDAVWQEYLLRQDPKDVAAKA